MNAVTGWRKFFFIGALMLTTIVMMGDSLITPASNTLYNEFNNEAGVNMLLSAPTFVAMFASILFGFLSEKIDKKILLLIGTLCFTISGVFGVAVSSLPYMVFMRVILGLGMGATNVCSISIIAQVFVDETQRSKYTSFITAGTSFCGIVLTLISGAIAEMFGWRSVFYIHWIGIIILVLVLFFVPKCPPIKADDEDDDGIARIPREENIKGWKVHFVALVVSQFVWYALYGLVFFQVAVYCAERAIGNEAFSGAMFSIVSTVAFIFCLLFSIVYKRFGRGCPVIYYGCFAVGFIIMLAGTSKLTTILACIIIGIGTGTGLSYFPFRGTVIVPKEKMSMAVTTYSAVMGIGMSLSTYIGMAIKGILGTDTFISMLPVMIAIAGGYAVLEIFLAIRDKAHPAKYYID